MPVKQHRITNGNIVFIIEQKSDEIEKVYFQFIGSYETILVPNVVTHRQPMQIKFTDFQFGNIYFQIYHELETLICVRYKYDDFDQFFHVKDVRSELIDDDDTISQEGSP